MRDLAKTLKSVQKRSFLRILRKTKTPYIPSLKRLSSYFFAYITRRGTPLLEYEELFEKARIFLKKYGITKRKNNVFFIETHFRHAIFPAKKRPDSQSFFTRWY